MGRYFIGADAVDLDDETDSARLLLPGRIVEAVGLRRFPKVAHVIRSITRSHCAS